MTGAEVTISGNITADPELRFTQNGVPVAGFNVAHTARRLNRTTNEWEDYGETLFLRVNVWREHGENVAASLHKGDPVCVIGRLVARSYETKDGEKRSSVEVEADIVSVDMRRARTERVMRVRRDVEAPEAWSPSEAAAAASAAA